MHSIKHAFRFIGASFSLALKHPQLQEPWFTLGIGSLVILFAWFLPMAAAAAFLGLTPWGLGLIGLLSVCVLSDLWVWGEMTALLTARAMDSSDDISNEEKTPNLQFLKKHGKAVFTLPLAKPVFLIGDAIRRVFTSKINERVLWLRAHTLALPIIAHDGLPLKETITRLQQVVKENLLPIREKFVRVRLVAGLTQLLLTAAGIFLAFWLGLKLAGPEISNPWQRILAVGIAMLAGWAPTFIGILFGSFTRTCYATSLYQWVKHVETARSNNKTEPALPPEILSQVLGTGRRQIKES